MALDIEPLPEEEPELELDPVVPEEELPELEEEDPVPEPEPVVLPCGPVAGT